MTDWNMTASQKKIKFFVDSTDIELTLIIPTKKEEEPKLEAKEESISAEKKAE